MGAFGKSKKVLKIELPETKSKNATITFIGFLLTDFPKSGVFLKNKELENRFRAASIPFHILYQLFSAFLAARRLNLTFFAKRWNLHPLGGHRQIAEISISNYSIGIRDILGRIISLR